MGQRVQGTQAANGKEAHGRNQRAASGPQLATLRACLYLKTLLALGCKGTF